MAPKCHAAKQLQTSLPKNGRRRHQEGKGNEKNERKTRESWSVVAAHIERKSMIDLFGIEDSSNVGSEDG